MDKGQTASAARQQKRREEERKKKLQAIKSRGPSTGRGRGCPPQPVSRGRKGESRGNNRPGLEKPTKRGVPAEELDGEISKRLQQVMEAVVPLKVAATNGMRRSLLDAEMIDEEEDFAKAACKSLSDGGTSTSDASVAVIVEEDILETSLPALKIAEEVPSGDRSLSTPKLSKKDKALRQSIAELHMLVDAKIRSIMQQRSGASKIPAPPVTVRPISANTKARSRIPAMFAQPQAGEPSATVQGNPPERNDRYGDPSAEMPPENTADPNAQAEGYPPKTETVSHTESPSICQRDSADLSLMASSSGTEYARSDWLGSDSQTLPDTPGGSLGYRESTEVGLLNLRQAAAQRSISGGAQISEFKDKHRTLTKADLPTTSTDQLLSKFMAGEQLAGADADEDKDSDAYSDDFCYSDDEFEDCELDLSVQAEALRGSLQQLQALMVGGTELDFTASIATCPVESVPASLNGTLSTFQLTQACNALQDTWDGNVPDR